MIENRPQVLEPVAQRAALACRVLQQHHRRATRLRTKGRRSASAMSRSASSSVPAVQVPG